ncbi:hypothetical protein [Clostridium hydrogeniformans]|nr:hypothetical protein [Clostridium hydrogeniformans]
MKNNKKTSNNNQWTSSVENTGETKEREHKTATDNQWTSTAKTKK